MTKRRHISKEQQRQGQEQDNEVQSVGTSLATQQLQHRASRNTESVFSQMLSRSK